MVIGLLLFGCVNGQWKGIAGYVDHVNGIDDGERPFPPEAENVTLPSNGFAGITIVGYDKKDLMEKIVAYFISQGLFVKVTEYEVIADRPMKGTRNAIMYGSRYNNVPNERLALFFTTQNEKVIYITAHFYLVTNPNSPFEKLTLMTNIKTNKVIQLSLNKMKQRIEVGQ